jgi:hypothetical protein
MVRPGSSSAKPARLSDAETAALAKHFEEAEEAMRAHLAEERDREDDSFIQPARS